MGSLALAGIPPFNGFWSKLIIVLAAVQSNHTVWAVTAVIMSVVALAYQLRVQKEALYASAIDDADETQFLSMSTEQFHESPLMTVPVVVLAISCVALSCLALNGLEQPFLVSPAAEALMRGPVQMKLRKDDVFEVYCRHLDAFSSAARCRRYVARVPISRHALARSG